MMAKQLVQSIFMFPFNHRIDEIVDQGEIEQFGKKRMPVIESPVGRVECATSGMQVVVPGNLEHVVTVIVQQLESRPENFEWEIKLGIMEKGFQAGVEKSHLTKISKWATEMLEQHESHWTCPNAKWRQMDDWFYLDDVRMSVVELTPEEEAAGMSSMTQIRKTRHSDLDISIPESSLCIRSSIKIETPISGKPAGKPRLLRKKLRKRFLYKNMFAFDFSAVWQGVDEKTASASSQNFEIEIELIDHTVLERYGTRWAALSMILKAYQLVHKATGLDIAVDELTVGVDKIKNYHS
jgi:hypothetical protein